MNGPNFALYYAGDAYSTSAKIMGRQSAGKALMRGVARRWPTGEVHAFSPNRAAAHAMAKQLQGEGFTGSAFWRTPPGDAALERIGAVYYPAPVVKGMAHARNTRGPTSYSLFGVTHTLSSEAAMDGLADLALAPYQSWDGLICTSAVALSVARRLQAQMREWQVEHVGATRFNTPSMSVIPLGIDAPSFERTTARSAEARAALGIDADDVAFLFAGRLVFHGKANPAPFYLSVEEASKRATRPIVCIEAGVYPNEHVAKAFREARAQLAPSVRFIEIDGAVQADFDRAWRAADIFVSLSDNIQETFGLTPLEAMAAGLPVLVSDWNGYKDTVRDGVDGYRIPVTTLGPDRGAGDDLAQRHALSLDTYDFFIGRISMTAAVDIATLTDRIITLVDDPGLRQRLGEAGRTRATTDYDWPVILDRYCDFARQLEEVRTSAAALRNRPAEPYPLRPDPYVLFQDYPTRFLLDDSRISARRVGDQALDRLLDLAMANYVVDDHCLPAETIRKVHGAVSGEEQTVASLLNVVGRSPATMRAMMWLLKLDLLAIRP